MSLYYCKNMREGCLRWFGHVQRRATNAPIRESELALVEGMKKSRGRPKITLIEVIKREMSIKGVIKSMTLDRV